MEKKVSSQSRLRYSENDSLKLEDLLLTFCGIMGAVTWLTMSGCDFSPEPKASASPIWEENGSIGEKVNFLQSQ